MLALARAAPKRRVEGGSSGDDKRRAMLCTPTPLGRLPGVAEAFVSLGVDLTPPPKCAGSPQGTELEGGETAVWRHVQHFVWDTDGLPKYKGATESFNHGDNNAVNAGNCWAHVLQGGPAHKRPQSIARRGPARRPEHWGSPGGSAPGGFE